MEIRIGTPSTYSPSKLISDKPPTSLAKGSYYLSLYSNSHLIGSLYAKKYEDTFILRGVEVLPEHRGSGLGKQIVQRILEHLKPKKLPIFLYVEPSNKIAISLYKKLGFQFVKRGTYGDKYQLKE